MKRPRRPNGYPTAPACFRDDDVAGLELQYQFYLRAYGPFDTAILGSGTRRIISYIQEALQFEYAKGNQATLFG